MRNEAQEEPSKEILDCWWYRTGL